MLNLRLALRKLIAQPGFTIAVVATLALGIGANAAIYSVLSGVWLRPAPVEALDRLLMVWETDRATGTVREPASVPDFFDYRRQTTTLSALGALMAGEVNLTPRGGDAERLLTLRVSHNLLPTLGIAPALGRNFLETEDRPGGEQVAVISAALALRLFNGAEAAIGRALALDERPHTIIGVVPDTTDFGVLQILSAAAYARSFADRGERAHVDVWLPLAADVQRLPRSTHPIFLVGRLAPGGTAAAAQTEMTGLANTLEQTYPENRGRGIFVEPLDDVIFGPVRPLLSLLLGAVVAVLLIACVNVANLLLARGAARMPEVAIRSAVGATLARLLQQFVTESMVLTGVAALAGIAAAWIGMRTLLSLAPADIPRLSSVVLDGGVLGATLMVTAVVAIVFGVIPTLQARRLDLVSALNDGASRVSGGRGGARVRGTLVVVELAAAVMLLSGAGLLIRSFWNLQHVDPGFRPEGVLKAEYQLPESRYPVPMPQWPDFKEQHAFSNALLARAAALPGVTSVAIAGNHPLDPGFTNGFRIVGREAEGASWPEISVRRVSSGYFETVGLPLKRGRLFQEDDRTSGPAVALINDAAVARFFGDRDPLGAQIRFWGIARTIVGVVGNEKFQGLTGAAPIAAYVPLTQGPSTNGAGVLLVKTASDPTQLAGPVRAIFRSQDPLLAVFGLEPLDRVVVRSLSQRRFAMLLLSVFAGAALLLAAVGVYGVLNYDVTQRRRELGIRLALGSRPAEVVGLVLARALRLVTVAVIIGVGGALVFSRFLATLLFGVGGRDPWTVVSVTGVLAIVALAAASLPAWRAGRTAPSTAFRGQTGV